MQQPRNPLLPVLLLLFFPVPHLWLVSLLYGGDASDFWQMGATVVFLLDGVFVLTMLALLKSASMRWRTRERGLMVVGCLVVALLLIGIKSPFSLGLFGGQLAAFIFSVLWLSRQKHLREIA